MIHEEYRNHLIMLRKNHTSSVRSLKKFAAKMLSLQQSVDAFNDIFGWVLLLHIFAVVSATLVFIELLLTDFHFTLWDIFFTLYLFETLTTWLPKEFRVTSQLHMDTQQFSVRTNLNSALLMPLQTMNNELITKDSSSELKAEPYPYPINQKWKQNYSGWKILKANGNIGICGDYKVTVNRHLRERRIQTVSRGPGISQITGMEHAQGSIQDDILVTGKTRQEHKNNLSTQAKECAAGKNFVGLVNYYSRFVPKFARIMRPLYELLKSDRKFAWDHGCEQAFNLIKQEIASATLSHKMMNGDLKPIAFISTTLSNAEGNYSVLDKEALAIYWATSKLRTYLVGHSFEIHTDHKPLIYLFGEQKGIPQMASARFQRWTLYLSGFQYKIKFVKGQANSVADMLSRHPLGNATRRDPTLSKIVKFVTEGWPDDFLKPFVQRKDEITCEQGCLMWGYTVIVPRKLQRHLLEELHSSHLGIVKMKSIARAYFWWPNLDKDIENIARSCIPNNKQRVHIDFLGPIDNSHYLIMLDAYSKWPEIFKMNSITSAATISKIRETCARWGIPETLVSDNGAQLTSEEFSVFLKRNGIRHVTGRPYKPETNGPAENAVRSSKLRLGRHLHTTLNLMRPGTNRDTGRQFNHKGRDSPTFEKGSIVWIRDYRKPNTKTWQEAKVIDILGPRNYTCELPDGQKWKRHVDQIRKRIEVPSTEDSKSETVQPANTNKAVPQRKMPGEPTMPSATPPLLEQTPSLEPQLNPIPVIPPATVLISLKAPNTRLTPYGFV
ncbi:uncharacterized protein LOC135138566 [Zophobas morio]|uniref:uncharacterized protein LOC135138566 n=1 Tax=Zophobas morio TaxID=2755281 RepID=UPI0030836150